MLHIVINKLNKSDNSELWPCSLRIVVPFLVGERLRCPGQHAASLEALIERLKRSLYVRFVGGQPILLLVLPGEEIGHDSQVLLTEGADGPVTLCVLDHRRPLEVQEVPQIDCHRVLLAGKMEGLASGDEYVAADERAAQEVVCDPVPLGPVEVDGEVGHAVLQPQLLPEVLLALEHGLHLVDSLREARYAIEGLVLPIDEVEDKVNGLNHVLVVRLRLRDCHLLRAVRQAAERQVLGRHPALEGRRDAPLHKVLDRRVRSVADPLDEGKLAQVAHGVDEVLHLEHHDLTGVVVAVQAEYAHLAWLFHFFFYHLPLAILSRL